MDIKPARVETVGRINLKCWFDAKDLTIIKYFFVGPCSQ